MLLCKKATIAFHLDSYNDSDIVEREKFSCVYELWSCQWKVSYAILTDEDGPSPLFKISRVHFNYKYQAAVLPTLWYNS
jgi:hypothetical protein